MVYPGYDPQYILPTSKNAESGNSDPFYMKPTAGEIKI